MGTATRGLRRRKGHARIALAALRLIRAIGSGGERFLHTEEVVGSNPTSPTMNDRTPRKGPFGGLRRGVLAGTRLCCRLEWRRSEARMRVRGACPRSSHSAMTGTCRSSQQRALGSKLGKLAEAQTAEALSPSSPGRRFESCQVWPTSNSAGQRRYPERPEHGLSLLLRMNTAKARAKHFSADGASIAPSGVFSDVRDAPS